ncbi:hypothetical protein AVEN_204393-1 [Araneus ventricosus]|uniref:Uncharacterized protein n=1 Tax=Araneus ventricosus TaxID=182803 RepID=A0A4Y2U384_ARAVE|nr:hypothetical protein AVEN_204393-1 [Araneus ventricosus]
MVQDSLLRLKPCSHGQWFDIPCSKYASSPVVGSWLLEGLCLERSVEMSVSSDIKRSTSTNGSLSTVPRCCTLCMRRENDTAGRIPTGTKIPMTVVYSGESRIWVWGAAEIIKNFVSS